MGFPIPCLIRYGYSLCLATPEQALSLRSIETHLLTVGIEAQRPARYKDHYAGDQSREGDLCWVFGKILGLQGPENRHHCRESVDIVEAERFVFAVQGVEKTGGFN